MSSGAIDLSAYEAIEECSTDDGLKIAHYKIDGRHYVDLDWESGSRWEFLDGVDPEEILGILLKHLYDNEEEIAEITAAIKVVSVEEFEELGGAEFFHALGAAAGEVDRDEA